ncbi:endoglucanase [Devosia crocina]|uniref:cellulase n=1 Tax=Devosia crocina TaxID=429728 RepID=A0A1I7N063_9HYPH|nr:glycosyl hydrolase family 8 [Devosia crocina]SFV28067.1 endoglucanase [Devosia crocina]
MQKLSFAALALGCLMTLPVQAVPVITADEWQSYLDAYVTEEGRVVDTANGNISHSESQGYGLILSALAENRESFDRILGFTRSELLVREDGLAAWLWDPEKDPHVSDFNNATDGDILIAYGLLMAGETWNEPGLVEEARAMVTTIGRTMLVEADGLPAIRSGGTGFDGDDSTGYLPVLNPSYWIFETFTAFRQLDPAIDWMAVSQTGLDILRRASTTTAGIPGDWITLENGGIAPAPNFPAEFGYNGIRIPLYLMRAGMDPAYLEPFRAKASSAGLFKIDLTSGEAIEPIDEPGYRLIQAAMECTATGRPVPEDLRRFAPTSYYAATLQLLMLDHLRRQRGSCLTGAATP